MYRIFYQLELKDIIFLNCGIVKTEQAMIETRTYRVIRILGNKILYTAQSNILARIKAEGICRILLSRST